MSLRAPEGRLGGWNAQNCVPSHVYSSKLPLNRRRHPVSASQLESAQSKGCKDDPLDSLARGVSKHRYFSHNSQPPRQVATIWIFLSIRPRAHDQCLGFAFPQNSSFLSYYSTHIFYLIGGIINAPPPPPNFDPCFMRYLHDVDVRFCGLVIVEALGSDCSS